MPLNTKRPEVGDWAHHKAGYDPREVIAVSEDASEIIIDVFGVATGWVPAVNYTFEKQEG